MSFFLTVNAFEHRSFCHTICIRAKQQNGSNNCNENNTDLIKLAMAIKSQKEHRERAIRRIMCE